MASPLSSDIAKPFGSTEKLAKDVTRAFSMPVPAFGDMGKAANDVSRETYTLMEMMEAGWLFEDWELGIGNWRRACLLTCAICGVVLVD